MALHYEIVGAGPPVVFLHAGIADSRMWDPQWTSLAPRYRLLRCDLSGFGRTPVERLPLTHARDVAALLEEVDFSAVALVGASLGGRVALELAIGRPELVGALLVVAPQLPGFAWSEAVRAFGTAEDDAVARGDLETATELNLETWVDGPRRTAGDVDAQVRARAAEMQLRAFELQAPHWDGLDEELLVSDVAERLGDIEAPTLVLVGEEDVEDMQTIAQTLAAAIRGARLAKIPGAAHLPNLERPSHFDNLVLEFLAGV